MNEQELMQFVQWLPSSIDEFKDKSPDEIVTILNKLSQTEEGMKTISGLINQFKQNSTGMFKEGGKLDFLVKKFQNGGKSKKVNPNDSKEISRSLNNNAGNRETPHDIFTTTGLVRDSLIKVGYNPTIVNRLAQPIIKTAEQKIVQGNYPAPENNTPRQFNLLKFLQPEIYYWAEGTADAKPTKSNGYKSERKINPNGSIRDIVTNPEGRHSYRDISADKRDTTYTNDLSDISRSNNPKWWKFRDKKVERQEYDKRDKAFNKRFKLD